MSNAKDADETFGVIYGQSKRTSCIDFVGFAILFMFKVDRLVELNYK